MSWESLHDADQPLDMPPANPLGVERTGRPGDPGGAANTYRSQGCGALKIFDVEIAKQVQSTSQAHTVASGGVEQLTVGEEATFLLTATLPEGITTNLVVEDELPYAAMVMEVLAARILPLPPDTNLGVPGFPPTPLFEDRFLGDGLGDTVVFAFGGPVSNAPDGQVDGRDRILMQVTGALKDLPANQNQVEDGNVARVRFGDGLAGSDAAPLRVVEPLLSLTKVADRTLVEAGDVIRYTLRLEHRADSRADAFDVALDDTLPPELALVPGSAVIGAECPTPPDSGPTEGVDGVSAGRVAFPRAGVCEIEAAATVMRGWGQVSHCTFLDISREGMWQRKAWGQVCPGSPGRT